MKSFYTFPEFISKFDDEFDSNFADLPFVFTQGYVSFLNKQGCNVHFYLKDGIFLMIGFKASRFVLTAYLIFPPLKGITRLSAQEEEAFYDLAIEDIKNELNPDQIIPHVPIEISSAHPNNSKSAVFGNVCIELSNQTAESLFANFQSSNRNIIRKAIRDEAYVKFGEDVFDDFYQLYADTHERQKLYYDPRDDIRSLYQSIKNNCICGVVYTKDNIPEGSILVPFSKYGGYSYFAGSVEKPIVRGAIKLLHWEVIQELKKKGIARFVLGGARINDNLSPKFKGMKDFKMSFGSSLQKGYLWKVNCSPRKIKLYQSGVKLKLKMKGINFSPDIIDQINTPNS